MLNLNDRVGKRRRELLAGTLDQILVAFARRQDQLIRCFLPSENIELKELLEGFLSREEKRFATEEMMARGFSIVFHDELTPAYKGRSYSTPEKKTTGMTIVACNYSPISSTSDDIQKRDAHTLNRIRPPTYECLNATEWRKQQEQYAFSWLFGTLNERVTNCTAGKDLFEFDLFIPLHYDSKVEYSTEARFDQRSRLFKNPIKWANLLSCYRVELKDYSTIKVVYKTPKEVEDAELTNNTLLFATLLTIDRKQEEKGLDWGLLPGTAFRIIFRMLVGKNIMTVSRHRLSGS